MATDFPIEIARMIIDCVEDEKTLVNLLLTTHLFRLLVEPYLYADVSFVDPPFAQYPTRYTRPSDADLWAVSRSFLQGITAGGGRCARYVKRLHLPAPSFEHGEHQYVVLQTILKSVPDLEHLQLHTWRDLEPVDLQILLGNPKSQSSPPPFTLKSFEWVVRGVLDGAGLHWFLSHQQSLERLFLPRLCMWDPNQPIPVLPRLRVLSGHDFGPTSQIIARNHVTHLKLDNVDYIHHLNDAILRHIVVCITWGTISTLAPTTMARMPNLECLEIDSYCESFPGILTQLGMLKGISRLRYLRILPLGVFTGTEDSDSRGSPWGYEDMMKALNSLLSLTHIIVQITRGPEAPEYFCFAKGAARPVKLRSRCLVSEWWHDWVEHCAVVPFEPGDRRMGYTGDLLDGAGKL